MGRGLLSVWRLYSSESSFNMYQKVCNNYPSETVGTSSKELSKVVNLTLRYCILGLPRRFSQFASAQKLQYSRVVWLMRVVMV